MEKKYQCMECNNTEVFIAEYRLLGQCLVAGDGTELELNHIDSIDNEHIKNELDTEIDEPCKCANCGSILIANVEQNMQEILDLVLELQEQKAKYRKLLETSINVKTIDQCHKIIENSKKEIAFYKKLLKEKFNKEVKACQD